jgi:DNA-binding MarR family transcriptional regulator
VEIMPPPRRSAQRRFDSVQQEAYLALWRTYDRLRAIEDELFAPLDLTAQQYNLLRLLRAEHPDPVAASGLAERLVSRAPDVTRMLDKLETRGLVRRVRSETDRRAIRVSITEAGIAQLNAIAGPLKQCHERQLGHVPMADLQTLIALLQSVRSPHEPSDSPWK